jgi:hypothetical protein
MTTSTFTELRSVDVSALRRPDAPLVQTRPCSRVVPRAWCVRVRREASGCGVDAMPQIKCARVGFCTAPGEAQSLTQRVGVV